MFSDDSTSSLLDEIHGFVKFLARGHRVERGFRRHRQRGDLWPTCWADDDALYSANGDGRGFGDEQSRDIVVNRITGDPKSGLTGERLAAADEVGAIWGEPNKYNRKPTGVVCVDGRLYLAIQDLRTGPGKVEFNDAPNASVSWSDDHGRTWQKTLEPMFTDHVFTTIFFLDFGRDSGDSEDALGAEGACYVYAYGLDGNWRTSYSDTVSDPIDLYLARAPKDAVENRSRSEFFAGLRDGAPLWAREIEDRQPVLQDARRQYPTFRNPRQHPHNLSVISQGGVVYIKPLRRYLYTSWTEYTFEFYEAPALWGPWRLFLTKDFGGYPWFGRGADCPGPKNGGYGTTIPSKFLSRRHVDVGAVELVGGQLLWRQRLQLQPAGDDPTAVHRTAPGERTGPG